ncbi:olfactory receptor 10A4-like [Chelonoidis abingdonii]|uniref:olfactory receptor 10A4-like n=1 Tax=Chelonoidis abingdonii TaxID=106734 RepID=UPI003F494681
MVTGRCPVTSLRLAEKRTGNEDDNNASPQILSHFLMGHKSISMASCTAQLYVSTILGLTECCLLAAMAYDHYVGICHPLHYTAIMSVQVCTQLAATSWVISILVEVVQTRRIFNQSFGGSNRIHHFFCDSSPMVKMVCTDMSKIKTVFLAMPVLFNMRPFLLIILSYNNKDFSTFSSHLMVMTWLYGTALTSYMSPKSSYSPESDQMISLMYKVMMPVFNPIISMLRNKEVKQAFSKTIEKSIFSHKWRN